MADRFTAEQRLAIDSQGKTIVSASAGSGKTTVMIEKIIRLIQSGCGVDEVLAVTFTKKAAAQMKEKLCKALIETINAPETTPEKKAELKKQLSEVPNADISTIHAFCSKLIRSHFFVAGVDNAFRIISDDDAEGRALKSEALDELLEEGYEEKDERFLHLLSIYWRKKSDNALRKIFLNTYKELRIKADYKNYLLNCAKYDEQTFALIGADLFDGLKEKCAYYLELVKSEEEFFQTEGSNCAAQLALCGELTAGLEEILSAPDYFSACNVEKPKYTSKKTLKTDSEQKKLHIERLAYLKEKIVKIYDKEMSETRGIEEEKQAFIGSGKTAEALSYYLLKFDEKYSALKTERNLLDYNDLEHKALALLKEESVRKEVKEKYRYVFVDEYQDVNPVQEELISRLSGENVFLVGDVKQSIYGFRGSKSKFFVEKQRTFEQGEGKSLAMKRNFRSSDAVLDAVNEQFSLAMNLQTCAVDYQADSYMERGGRYALNDGRVQIHFLGKEEKEGRKTRGVYSVRENASRKAREESLLAKTIRSIIEKERASDYFDADSGEYKRVTYSDIAILSRKKQGQIAQTVALLSAEGIPVTSGSSVNICDYAEIKTLIDILSLLDNKQQDVPLCSALLSSMGGLSADDLTTIRLAYKKEAFFRNAVQKYAEEQTDGLAKKLQSFYAYFERLKRFSYVLNAGELLTKLLSETRMEAELLSRDNGVSCLKRIHRFIEETNVEEPLFVHEFLQRLRNLDYKIEYSENGGEDSVKVLTMHSSKGLEYPIVILDNLSASFRSGDVEEVYVEEKYGLAPRAFDTNKMTKSTTLLRALHEKKERDNSIADELNLYYVALTRAKFGLHLIFDAPPVMPNVRYANSFAEFTDFEIWKKYVMDESLFDLQKQERTALVFKPDETLVRAVINAFLWKYPYTGGENLPVKSSATALLDKNSYIPTLEEERMQELILEEHTSIDAGLAYHAFLEKFDFSLLYTEENVVDLKAAIKETLLCLEEEQGGITALLKEEKLVEILQNKVFYGLQDMRLYKEQQFLVSLLVKDTYAKGEEALQAIEDEEMIFQGAIDLLAVGENCAQIIDYKYSKRGAKELAVHYRPQLELYRLAVAKILKIPKENIRCSIVNIYKGFQVEIDEMV